MRKVKFFLTVLSMLAVSFAYAQNITVKGTVTDAADNSPLIGAGVQVKGSTQGASTDVDGNFEISCSPNATLVVSYVGYEAMEIAVNGKAVVNVQLKSDSEMLEDVMVIGYGSAKKISSVVGAATTVKKQVFQNRPVASAGDALQGQVAGLQVFTSSGEPSAAVSMRLRGVNSINASNTPLFILDGSPVSSSVFTTLNSNDIENITVLKDASSTAIYGSRAANGVVYITTKKGASERPTVKISAQYGISSLANNPYDMCNTEQYFQLREMIDPSLVNNAQFQALKKFRIDNNFNFDWRSWILDESAPTVSGDLSIAGRTQRMDYYVSFSAFDQKGVEPYSGLTRYGVRSNINSKVTDWLKVGLNLGLTYQETETAGYSGTGNSWYNPMSIADWNLPYAVPYEILTDANGNFTGFGEELTYIDDMGTYNYYYLMDLQPTEKNYIRLNGNTYQEITPFKGLVIRASQAIEGYDYRYSSKVLPDPLKLFSTTKASESFYREYTLTSTNTAEYKFSFAEKHNVVLLAGHESIVNQYEGFGATSNTITDVRTSNVDQGTDFVAPSYSFKEKSYNSYFGRVNYDYADKYHVEATFRRDGSSLFGENKRYANFYSFGANWNAKKESFLEDVDWLDKLNVRVSYGTTGNSGIDEYLANGLLGSSSQYNGETWGISRLSNPNLTWETVESTNIGISTRLFDLVDVELEFYNKNTKDMLMEIPYSYSTGFSGGWGNVGNMNNKGIDLTVNFNVLNTKDMTFNVSGTFNYNKNEITELFGGRDEFVVANTGLKYQVGKPVGEFYYTRWAGVDPATGKQLWLDKDGNLTDVYSEDDAVFTGKQRYAPYAAGLQLDFAWKGLSVSAAFSGVFGKWTISNTRYFIENSNFAGDMNQAAVLLDMWQKPGDITRIPAANEPLQFDTHLLENASFVRLKNLQIAYTLPKKWCEKAGFLSGARVYAIGRNLLTFTEYTGYDPEVDSNLQLGNYPNSKQFSFGVELTF